MEINELNERLPHLQGLIEAEKFTDCLSEAIVLLDKFYGVPSLHYAIAICLFKTNALAEATMHLEIAASKFKLTPSFFACNAKEACKC